MRYSQSKNESAELLRLALARMAAHDAAMNPMTFAVWYEHLAGINPRLSQELERHLQSKKPVDDATVLRLHRNHIAEVDEAAAQRVSEGFGRVMQSLSESAASTGDSAAAFGERLGSLRQTLRAGDDAVPAAQIGEAIDWSQRMQQALDKLQAQVDSSRVEVGRLREDLDRTREEALRCPLTKVLNRRGFDLQLDALLSRAQATHKQGALVMIDIDSFKAVNDVHGHLVGDRVLEGVGETLRRLLAAQPGACVARFGGEEFTILLPECLADQARALAEAARQSVKRMRILQRNSDKTVVTVTVSAGVTVTRDGDHALTLIARADEALYESKRGGRDRVTLAEPASGPRPVSRRPASRSGAGAGA